MRFKVENLWQIPRILRGPPVFCSLFETVVELFELGRGTAGYGPAEIVRKRRLGKVLRDKLAGKTAGAR